MGRRVSYIFKLSKCNFIEARNLVLNCVLQCVLSCILQCILIYILFILFFYGHQDHIIWRTNLAFPSVKKSSCKYFFPTTNRKSILNLLPSILNIFALNEDSNDLTLVPIAVQVQVIDEVIRDFGGVLSQDQLMALAERIKIVKETKKTERQHKTVKYRGNIKLRASISCLFFRNHFIF